MSRTERIVFAFGALGETIKAIGLPDLADAITAACQDLVRIGLMAHVPDQPVGRGVVDIMQRNGQFDHTETCPEVPAGFCRCVNGFGAQFAGHLQQIFRLEFSEIGWKGYCV